MKFNRFEDLWCYSEKIASEEDISSEEAIEKVCSAIRDKKYGEAMYYLSLISYRNNINIFIELQKSVTDNFVARQEDD